MRGLKSGRDLVVNLRSRTMFLDKQVSYRSETDLTPVASSLAEITLISMADDEPRATGSLALNILGDEYWDIPTVLLSD